LFYLGFLGIGRIGVSLTCQMWLVIKRHSRQLGLDFADE